MTLINSISQLEQTIKLKFYWQNMSIYCGYQKEQILYLVFKNSEHKIWLPHLEIQADKTD